MKASFLIFLLPFLLASCKTNGDSEVLKARSTVYIQSDSLHAVVFKPNHRLEFHSPDTSMSILEIWPILSSEGWVPSKDTLIKFKETFTNYWQQAKNDSLAELNNLTLINWRRIDILDYQVIGYIDSTNTKKMFINIGNWDALSMPNSDWKEK